MALRAVSAFSYKCFMNLVFSVLGFPGLYFIYYSQAYYKLQGIKEENMTCQVKSVVAYRISVEKKNVPFHIVSM